MTKWLRQNVKGALTVAVGQRNSATEMVDQQLLFVGSEAGKLLAFRELVRTGLQPPVLVFVDTKVSVDGGEIILIYYTLIYSSYYYFRMESFFICFHIILTKLIDFLDF